MAAQNPWSMLDPDTQKQLSAMGAQALASGEVSKKEAAKAQAAAKAYQFMGPPAPDDSTQDLGSPISMGVNPQAASPVSMTGRANPLAPMLSDLNGVKGGKGSVENDSMTKISHSMNRLLNKDPDTYRAGQLMKQGIYPKVTGYKPATDENGAALPNGVLDEDRPIYDFNDLQHDPNDPVEQQKQGVGRMEDLLRMQGQANQLRPTMDYSPLAAFADYLNGQAGRPSNLAASAKAPEDQTQKFMAYADEIQKRKNDIQKGLSENNSALSGGSAMNGLIQALNAKNAEGFAPVPGGARQETAFLGRITHDAKDLRLQDNVLSNVSQLLAQWNPTADREVKTQLARLIEGTVRPQIGVINASGGDPSWWQGLLNQVETIGSGQMTAEQRGQYMKELQVLKHTHDQNAQALRTSWDVQNQRLMNPYTEDEMGRLTGMATPNANAAAGALAKIAPPKNVGKPKSQAGAPAQEKSVKDMNEAELDAYLAKHGG